MIYAYRDYYIPERMMESLQRYIEHKVPLGGFLTAVICNDLAEACKRADEENLENLPAFVAYLYNEAPSQCWGSEEKMNAWLEARIDPSEGEERL